MSVQLLIATVVGRSVATFSRFVARLGLSSLNALEPAKPVLRYEHEVAGCNMARDGKGTAMFPAFW